jgi:membrane fusion protein (multidrug efflux system)
MNSHKNVLLLTLAVSLQASAQTPAHVDFATVESRNPSRTVALPAELAPFLQADIEARVPGYIERVLVDRVSKVRRGQLLVELSAPEMKAQTAAAEASFHQAEADQSQAEAQAAGVESTFARLQEASKTSGAVAGNELVQSQKERDAAESLVSSRKAGAQTRLRRLDSGGPEAGFICSGISQSARQDEAAI